MRLGELLLQKGVITAEQLQTALHEQHRCGGRFGTNLIELGYVDVDTIALALSVQRGVPALRREHIAAIDPRVLGVFPDSVVNKHRVVPVGYTMTKPPRVVIACADPTAIPIDELAFAAGSRIEVWIAPEALVQECLVRYFRAAPIPPRYVSVKLEKHDATSLASLRLPTAANLELAPAPAAAKSAKTKPASAKAAKAAKSRRVLSPPPPPPTAQLEPPPAPQLEPPAPPQLEPPPPPPLEQPPALALAAPLPSVVRTLAPPSPPSIEFPPPGSSIELPPEDDWDIPTEAASSIPPDLESHPATPAVEARPLTVPPEARPLTAPPEALRPVVDRPQASMLMEMATSKEQIGRALEDWLRSTFGCGLVLIIKGDMAIGWRGFFPDADDLIEAVAITLAKPSMFATAFESRVAFRGAPPESGAKIQDLLWKLLRCAAPSEALVCPVVMGKRVVNLIYAHMEDGSALTDGAVEDAVVLCGEAAAAYARLIGRDRKKK